LELASIAGARAPDRVYGNGKMPRVQAFCAW